MHHVMLDLETYGVRPGAVIRSIGAVEFEVDGRVGDRFYRNIDQRSCEVIGLTIDPETRTWWAQQPGEVQKLLKDPAPEPLRAVANDFFKWFKGCGGSAVRVWSHGAAFDPVLWTAAAEACGSAAPWSYWNIRDTRTVFDMAVFDIRERHRDSLPHSALDDCLFQIECLAAAYQRFDLKSTAYLKEVAKQKPPAADIFG